MAVTVRDSYTTAHNNNRELRRTSAQQKLAQTYLTTSAYQITRIDTWLYKANSPVGSIWMEIYSTSASNPTGSALAVSDTIDVSTIPAAQTQTAFTFSTPFEVADATTYAMALNGNWTIDNANFVWEYEHHIGAYASGQQFWWNGSAWTAQVNDWWFEVRGDDIAPAGPVGVDLVMGKTIAQIDLFMGVPIANIDSIMGRAASVAEPVVTELQDNFAATPTKAALGGSGGAFAQGNTFIPGVNYNIASVAFPLSKTNSPTGSCWYEMRNWNATISEPTTLIARTTGMDVSTLPAAAATYINKQWSATPVITSGKTYAIFAKVDFSGGVNNVGQYYQGGNNYASGLQIYQLYTASAWNTAGNDFAFRSYGKDA